MARNLRPKSYTGSLDYTWGQAKLYERESAQNLYDLLEAQEKANNLKLKELERAEQKELDKAAEESEKLNTRIDNINARLCERYNVNESALSKFANILNYGNINVIREINELTDKLPQYYNQRDIAYFKKQYILKLSLFILGIALMSIFFISLTKNNMISFLLINSVIYVVLHIIIFGSIHHKYQELYGDNLLSIIDTDNKIKSLKADNEEFIYLNYAEFNKFRSSHYNIKLEELFSKLVGKRFRYFEAVENNNIKFSQEQSLEAYRKYINNVIKNAEI